MSKNPALTKEGLTALIFLALLAFVFWGGESEKAPQEGPNKAEQADRQEEEGFSPPESWHKLDKSKEMQELREDFIQSYKNKDLIDRVGDAFGYSLQVYVGSAWKKTKLDMKKTCISNIFAYYFAKSPKLMSITLKDPRTDQRVEKYSYHAGHGTLSLSH